jgi:hypothetical protein
VAAAVGQAAVAGAPARTHHGGTHAPRLPAAPRLPWCSPHPGATPGGALSTGVRAAARDTPRPPADQETPMFAPSLAAQLVARSASADSRPSRRARLRAHRS